MLRHAKALAKLKKLRTPFLILVALVPSLSGVLLMINFYKVYSFFTYGVTLEQMNYGMPPNKIIAYMTPLLMYVLIVFALTTISIYQVLLQRRD